MAPNDIEGIRQALREACADTTALLVDASTSGLGSMPTFSLEFQEFLKVLRVELPKVVFLSEATFDIEESIESTITDAIGRRFRDDDELDSEVARIAEVIRSQLAEEIQTVADKDGAVYRFVAIYAEHGALRATSHYADWCSSIESRIIDAVEAYVGKWTAEQNAVVSVKERTKRVAAQKAVATLVNDPEFRRIKGMPKRSAYVLLQYPNLVPPDEKGQQRRPGQNLPLIDAAICDVIRIAHLQVTIAEDSNR